MKKFEYKIDRNILVLYDTLELMSFYYNFDKEIEHNLKKFILYLEQFLYKHECDNDIIDDELIRIVTYKENNANL